MNAPLRTPNAQHEPEIKAGSVEAIRNRKTNQIIGWRGRLPRSLSTPPKGCKNPDSFREWATELCTDRIEAIQILNTVIEEITKPGAVTRGRTFEDFAKIDLDERYQKSLRRVSHPPKARDRIKTWRTIYTNWLPQAPFWNSTPAAISVDQCDAFVKWLMEKARLESGERMSVGYVGLIVQQMRSIFRHAGVNPESNRRMKRLDLSEDPDVVFMTLEQQCRFFACEDIDRRDRVMAGIGMGLGLRVNELLALERAQVVLTSEKRGFVRLKYGGNHGTPLKGRKDKTRKIQLHEPGIGFLRIWLEEYYDGGKRLFNGPKGGYLGSWEKDWADWSRHVGCKMHSHLMRHTYAVSMLSSTWGYARKDLLFIKTQLGHSSVRTTEKYYADWAEGTWEKEVDEMADEGEALSEKPRRVILAGEAFLNGTAGLLSGLSAEPKEGKNPGKTAKTRAVVPVSPPKKEFAGKPDKTGGKAACDGPVYQHATPVAFVGRFQPRRRRKTGGVA